MKYIDAERLKAEIERQKRENLGSPECVCDDILSLVTSLQQEQPGVDLENVTNYSRINELPEGFDKEWLKYYHTNNEYNSVKFHHMSTVEREYVIARHFFNLGLNSKK